MRKRRSLTDLEKLELYRVALINAEAHPRIAEVLQEMGYSSGTITEGKQLLDETNVVHADSLTQKAEMNSAHNAFTSKRRTLARKFNLDRQKARVVFRKDPSTAEKLGVVNGCPRTYVKWIAAAKKFYSSASEDVAVQEQLAGLKLSAEQIGENLAMIHDIEAARAVYMKEKAQSQDATMAKNAAFRRMGYWMSAFYAVARIALGDQPQLMEALGKVVKN